MTHEELTTKALSNQKVKNEYDSLAPEFSLLKKYAEAVNCHIEIKLVHN